MLFFWEILITIHSTWRVARTELAESKLGREFYLGLKTAAAAGVAGLMALSPANAQEGKFYESINGKVVEISETAAQGSRTGSLGDQALYDPKSRPQQPWSPGFGLGRKSY